MRLNRRSFWALIIAGILVCSLGACGKGSSKSSEGTTVYEEYDAEEETSVVDTQVELPGNFENMTYPILALLVQENAKGYEYYNLDQEEDPEPDSFFYSMAALASLMETRSPYGDGIEADNQYIITENTADMYASALYNDYGAGRMEFPEIPEDDKYASRDETTGDITFIKGTVTYDIHITACEEDGQDYNLTVDLVGSDKEDIKGTYTVSVTQTSYEGENNLFPYSVKSVIMEARYDFDQSEETATENGTENESGQTGEQATEDSGSGQEADDQDIEDDPSIDEEETAEDYESEGEEISQEEALELAGDYYGSEAEFKGMVTIGDDEYYDFTVSEGDTPDVLVSKDGEDVIGAVENEDGSWTFDQ